MGQQANAIINLDGGLDLVSTHYGNQAAPGSARVLTNFEPSLEGGYRRINGFTRFGTAQPSGGANEVFGVYPYADGVVAVSASGVYFSTDGTTWLQVNRDTYTAQTGTVSVTDSGSGFIDVTGVGTAFTTEFSVGDHCRISGSIRQIASITSDTVMTLESEIAGGVSAGTAIYKNGTTSLSGTVQNRTAQGTTQFAWFPSDGEYGSLVMTDTTKNNDPAWFKITGSGVSRVYEYDTLTAADFAAPATAALCCTFEQRVILACTELQTVFYSERFSNKRFDGNGSGSVRVEGDIVAIKPFKDRLIIFCTSSIYQLTDINTPSATAVLPIAYNTGCAASMSVQELGGDLIFLSHDGIRQLSATDQYGDVQLGIISYKIDPYVSELLESSNSHKISSAVIRKKNQYRLFYTRSTEPDAQQLGLCGVLKLSKRTGGVEWQWSRLQGIPVSAMESVIQEFINPNETENIYHGAYDGYVYKHDDGNDFNGEAISAAAELNEIDYDDIGLRKTLHYVRLFGDVEGGTDDIDLEIQYDFGSDETMQPSGYTFGTVIGVALYGFAIYGTSTYGGEAKFNKRVLVEGSGFSNNFRLSSSGTGAPYSINSLYVDLRTGVKQ